MTGRSTWVALAAALAGAVLAIAAERLWLRGEPAAAGPLPASVSDVSGEDPPAPPLPADPEPARALVLRALAEAGVPAEGVRHGTYPLRGPGRSPDETLALVGFACPAARSCDAVLAVIEARARAGGYAVVGTAAGDQEGRPRFRALAIEGRPALALRAWPPGPRLTLVLDGVGREPGLLEALLAVDEHVTYAVLANAPNAPEVATRLAAAGREVAAQLPMEPQPPIEPDGAGFLTTARPPEDTAPEVEALLARVPGAVGVAPHLGSRYTTSAPHMAAVLGVLRARAMFFLDGRTSPASVAEATARAMGVRSAVRTHHLDLPGTDLQAAQRAVEAALVLDGQAVVVAHAAPATLAALRPWLADLKRRGIHLLRLSEIVL